jgi:hypothetical protein
MNANEGWKIAQMLEYFYSKLESTFPISAADMIKIT